MFKDNYICISNASKIVPSPFVTERNVELADGIDALMQVKTLTQTPFDGVWAGWSKN